MAGAVGNNEDVSKNRDLLFNSFPPSHFFPMPLGKKYSPPHKAFRTSFPVSTGVAQVEIGGGGALLLGKEGKKYILLV